jgi:hypothetical protein
MMLAKTTMFLDTRFASCPQNLTFIGVCLYKRLHHKFYPQISQLNGVSKVKVARKSIDRAAAKYPGKADIFGLMACP